MTNQEFQQSIKESAIVREMLMAKDSEYIKLRGAAMMFLEAEKAFKTAKFSDIHKVGTRLDAARSVLWDVINDKDLTKQS